MSDQDDNNTGDQNQQQENAGPSPSPGRAEARRAQANARLAQAVLEQVTNKVPTAHQFPTETKTMSNGTQYQAIILTSTCVHEGCQARPTDAFSTFGCPYIPIEDSESVAVDGAVSPRDAASPSGINTTSATTS